MPYIEAKLSVKLDDSQKDKLQSELVNAVSAAFSKLNQIPLNCNKQEFCFIIKNW